MARTHRRRGHVTHFYHRVVARMGGITHKLVPQKELAALAHPFYHQLRAVEKDTWKSARMFITRSIISATWCWR